VRLRGRSAPWVSAPWAKAREQDQLPRSPPHEGNRTVQRTKPKARGNRALAVFEKVVRQQQDAEPDDPLKPREAGASLRLYEDFSKLVQMRSQADKSLGECFDFFYTRIFSPSGPVASIPAEFKTQIAQILSEVESAKTADGIYVEGPLPTVTTLTRIRRQLSLFRRQQGWADMMLGLVGAIRNISTSSHDYDSTEAFEKSKGDRSFLLDDLVGAWGVFSSPFTHGHSHAQGFRFPSSLVSAVAKGRKDSSHNFRAIGAMFPHYTPHGLQEVAAAVVATFALLSDTSMSTAAARRASEGFLETVQQIFFAVPLRTDTVQVMFRRHPDLEDYVLDQWGKSSLPLVGANRRASKTRSQTYHKQLGQALKSRDLGACSRAWEQFYGSGRVPDALRTEELRHNAKMFDYFIMVFTALKQPQRASEVWTKMTQIGIQPTIVTWTSFLEGCKHAKNAPGIENAWARLVQAGIQLDVVVWTARISGLAHAGAPEAGLAALEEMRTIWERSQQDEILSRLAVRPSIEPVNAMISGLLRAGGDLAAASKILAWAARSGIEPDARTFNTLLQRVIRGGNEGQALALLNTMKDQKIQADEATFTILMEGILPSVSREERLQVGSWMFSEMQAAGLEANHRNYAKLIYLLLQGADRAEDAVAAVLAEMDRTNLKPSSQIYTILVEDAFSQKPPDLATVDYIIMSRRLDEAAGLDRVFWERVVKGYAAAGDSTNAMKYYDKIATSMSVTFTTLETLLQALVADGKLDEASTLVKQALAQRLRPGTEQDDTQARFWKHRFWHVAAHHHLIDEIPVDARTPP